MEKEKETKKNKEIVLKDGRVISNLHLTYGKIFEFQNKHKDISRDLIEVITTKRGFDSQSVMQIIYVAYLCSGADEKPMEYYEFLDSLNFDYKRDMTVFYSLINGDNNSKN